MGTGLLSGRFWLQAIVSTLFTMAMIYAIKKVADKYNVPIVKTVADGI